MAGKQRAPNRKGKPRVQSQPPCLRLKALRERAGVTGRECAAACAEAGTFTKGNANNWFRIEAPRVMGDELVPHRYIEPVLPLLVGKGTPPITADELIVLSDARGLARGVAASERAAEKLPSRVVSPMFPREASSNGMLTVQLRAERGVYMDARTVAERSYGLAPISVAGEYRPDVQFAATVADDHAAPVYRVGTVLHCVDVGEFSPKSLAGRRVVCSVPAGHGIELCEISVGQVESVFGNTTVVRAMDGRELDGSIVGVVIGHYTREV